MSASSPPGVVVPVLVASVAPETSRFHLVQAARSETVLPSRDRANWIVVDPPPDVTDAVRAVTGCTGVRPAWAVAVLLGVPEVAPVLARLRVAAQDTIAVEDPDFGPVAYALFATPEEAVTALGC